jgi:hypothetical protein
VCIVYNIHTCMHACIHTYIHTYIQDTHTSLCALARLLASLQCDIECVGSIHVISPTCMSMDLHCIRTHSYTNEKAYTYSNEHHKVFFADFCSLFKLNLNFQVFFAHCFPHMLSSLRTFLINFSWNFHFSGLLCALLPVRISFFFIF